MSTDAKDVVPFEQRCSELVGLPDAARCLLLDDVKRGLADIAAGRTEDANAALARLQQGLARRPQRRLHCLHGITIRGFVMLGGHTWRTRPR
jgi:hypothetical protein